MDDDGPHEEANGPLARILPSVLDRLAADRGYGGADGVRPARTEVGTARWSEGVDGRTADAWALRAAFPE
jgi:hypothetical protein